MSGFSDMGQQCPSGLLRVNRLSASAGAEQKQAARQQRLTLRARKIGGRRNPAKQHKEIEESPPETLFIVCNHPGKTSAGHEPYARAANFTLVEEREIIKESVGHAGLLLICCLRPGRE